MHLIHYSASPSGPMYDWQLVHFCDELRRQGHEVTTINPVTKLGEGGRRSDYSEVLVSEVKKLLTRVRAPLFFTLSSDDVLETSAVEAIRQYGIPCVSMSVDDAVAPYQVRRIGPHFDLHWTTYHDSIDKLRRWGCEVFYAPMASNPHFFQPSSKLREHMICFVGSRYGARPRYVQRIGAMGLPMRVRGTGWSGGKRMPTEWSITTWPITQFRTVLHYLGSRPGRRIIAGAIHRRLFMRRNEDDCSGPFLDLGGPLSSWPELVDFYARHTLSLGVLEAGYTFLLSKPFHYYRLREFEATCMGCAHLVQRTSELEESFDGDREIVFYDTLDECAELAKYYLNENRQETCRAIGNRARTRVQGEHTWTHRFAAICRQLGFNWN